MSAVRTWTEAGREVYGHVGTEIGERPTVSARVGRRRIDAAIEALEWRSPEDAVPMAAGLGIATTIRHLHLPKVSLVAISHDLAPYGLYGIEANYKDGRARVYVVDRGSDLIPVASDFPVAVQEQR